MRFQQLKRNANFVLRKKLYKSGKNWVVRSTLSLAGGLILFGGSQLTVKADVTSDSTQSEEVQSTANNDGEPNTDAQGNINVVSPANSNTNRVAEDDTQTQPVQSLSSTTNNQDSKSGNNINPENQQVTNVGEDNNNGVDGSVENSNTPSSSQNNNSVQQPVQPQAESTNVNSTLPTTIARGTWGTSDWRIKDDGAGNIVLHIGAGTFNDTHYNDDTDYRRPWSPSDSSKVTQVVFDGNVKADSSLNGLFYSFGNLTNIQNLNYLDTSSVTDTSQMFEYDSKLEYADFSNFDFRDVKKSEEMFKNCFLLKGMSFGPNFVGTNLVDGSGMFQSCKSLTSLDLSMFSTPKLEKASNMFFGEVSLTSLDVSAINTSKVNDFTSMFSGEESLESLNVSNIDFSNATSLESLFSEDTKLSNLTLPKKMNTSKVENFYRMFYGCPNLKQIDTSSIDTSNANRLEEMFSHDYGLQSIDVSGFNTSKVTNFSQIFAFCTSLKTVDLSNWNMKKSVRLENDDKGLFGGGTELDTIVLGPEDNLVSPGIFDKDRNSYDKNGNVIRTNTGWKAIQTTSSDINQGYTVSSFMLTDDMYNGKDNPSGVTTWQINYTGPVDFSVKYIASDTGKILYTVSVPGEFPGDIYDAKKLSSYGDDVKDATGYQIDENPSPDSYTLTNDDPQEFDIKVDPVPVYGPLTVQIIESNTKIGDFHTVTFQLPNGDGDNSAVINSEVNQIAARELVPSTTGAGGAPLMGSDKKPIFDGSYFEDLDKNGEQISFGAISSQAIETLKTMNKDSGQALADMLLSQYTSSVDTSDGKSIFALHLVYEPIASDSPSTGGNSSNSSSSSDSSTSDNSSEYNSSSTTKKETNTISTYPDQEPVQIYDNNGAAVGLKKLQKGSNWQSDAVMELNNETYYRVATNEWIKTSDAYVYDNDLQDVRVYNNVYGRLVNSEGKTLGRALRPTSEWKSDRFATINGEKYYRVASNEFVKADDIYGYNDIPELLHTNSLINLYDERGNNISVVLPINRNYTIDKVISISGIKYYRVATNEFVKSTDDINII